MVQTTNRLSYREVISDDSMNKDNAVCNDVSCPLLWMTVCAGFGLLFGIVFEGGNLQLSMTLGAVAGLAIPSLGYANRAITRKKSQRSSDVTLHTDRV